MKRMKIVLAGGAGQVGTLLARHFHAGGHEIVVFSRSPHSEPWQTVQWDGRTLGAWVQQLRSADVLINLAGRSVNCRYNEANRQAFIASRVDSTRVLGEAIASLDAPPRVWMNSSTGTIYRHALDRPMDEETASSAAPNPGLLIPGASASMWPHAGSTPSSPRHRR